MLSEGSENEAKLRSSISRAYYAAFCSARNYISRVDRKDPPANISSVHQYVIDYFKGKIYGSPQRKERKKIGEELRRMRDARRKADYDNYFISNTGLYKTAEDVLIRSERVISLVEKGGI